MRIVVRRKGRRFGRPVTWEYELVSTEPPYPRFSFYLLRSFEEGRS